MIAVHGYCIGLNLDNGHAPAVTADSVDGRQSLADLEDDSLGKLRTWHFANPLRIDGPVRLLRLKRELLSGACRHANHIEAERARSFAAADDEFADSLVIRTARLGRSLWQAT